MASLTPSRQGKRTKWGLRAWLFFDFANSAFPTIIITALYVLYFKKILVVGDPAAAGTPSSRAAISGLGDWYWGLANSLGAFLVFFLAPALGFMGDSGGRKARFLRRSSFLCIGATVGLGLLGPGDLGWGILLLVLAILGFELAAMFYNAFLPEFASSRSMASLSGLAWGLGYVGGLLSLLVCIPFLGDIQDLRYTAFLVAAWFFLFGLPTFLFVKDRDKSSPKLSLVDSYQKLGESLRKLSSLGDLPRFLIAFFFYNNGLLTVIVFAVAFTNQSLGFSAKESLFLVLFLNLLAAPGAIFLGRVASKWGEKRTISWTLMAWMVVVLLSFLLTRRDWVSPEFARKAFWLVAGLAALCIGATQATSRAFVGLLAPRGQEGEYYGYMALSGKASGVLGPLFFGMVSRATGDQGLAILSIGVFFLLGLSFLRGVGKVQDKRAA